MSDSSSDEIAAIVLDNGSYMTKIGFAGDDAPRSVFPTCIGSPKNTGQLGWKYKDTFVGDEADPKTFPIEHGIIKDWDKMEKIWHHAFYNELRLDPKMYVLITEAPLNPKVNREKIAQIMFEKFEVPGLLVWMTSLLTIYACGYTTGMAVDTGGGVTHVVPSYQGNPIEAAIQRIDIWGQDLTNYMTQLLCERGYSFATSSELEIVNDIKEKLCYLALDFDEEIKKNGTKETAFVLPDGNSISVGSEMFRVPEAMFNTSLLLGKSSKSGSSSTSSSSSSFAKESGLHNLIHDSVTRCEADINKTLLDNIVLSGGNTMFPNLEKRVGKELSCLLPPSVRAKVIAPPERKYSVWIGGSILASLGSMANRWVTKWDYVEVGPVAVHKNL